ncbi:ribonuclease H-like domain-containing protein [Schizophyllum amplum]|uniref:Ribonuclease H-like domain-containing protein n=1 Tax=Schizophyllum amplum TaxID=97359 RepID=A0A550CQD7_9AGAR|nr:ribonuclease H-like domain-containing protein [Auriculariopsis ampla]
MAGPVRDSLVATEGQLVSLVNQLRLKNIFAFVTEGVELGSIGGALSAMSFRTLNKRSYLVDVLAFTPRQMQPLFDIIADESVTKLMWDGRMDASELLHGHAVELRGALDLQLADVDARRRRESFFKQKCRLRRRGLRMRKITKEGFKYVHRLNGLAGAAEEYGVIPPRQRTYEPVPQFDQSRWLQRPFTDVQIEYAAEDVRYIMALYHIFSKRRYIADEESLKLQTRAYHAIYRAGRRDKGNIYTMTSLMPLEILDLPTSQDGATSSCHGCRRDLTKKSFALASADKCFVCVALDKEQGRFPQPVNRDSARKGAVRGRGRGQRGARSGGVQGGTHHGLGVTNAVAPLAG